jgi:RNase adapter protein RapZ
MVITTSKPNFMVIGSSQSGISTALDAYEALGYLRLSGIPLSQVESSLLPFLEKASPVAFSIKLSAHDSSELLKKTIDQLKSCDPDLKTLQLDAEDAILANRFLESGMPHSFEQEGIQGLSESISLEKTLLKNGVPQKEYSIDTSILSPKELAGKVAKILGVSIQTDPLQVYIKTFGFKYGPPTDAELVFDMRFMTNPFYDDALKKMIGLDKPVQDYLFGLPGIPDFFERWSALIGDILPMYHAQGKARITIAVGCTGGKHRSVCMGNALANTLKERYPGFNILLQHREQNSWGVLPPTTNPLPPISCETGSVQS